MPSIPLIKVAKLIRILERNGYTVDKSKGKGSHAKLYGKNGGKTIIPKNVEAPSTRNSIGKFLISDGADLDEMFK